MLQSIKDLLDTLLAAIGFLAIIFFVFFWALKKVRKLKEKARFRQYDKEVTSCLNDPENSNRYDALRQIVAIKRKYGVSLSQAEELAEGPLAFAFAILGHDASFISNYDGEPPFDPYAVEEACNQIGANNFGKILSELINAQVRSYDLLRTLENEGIGDERYNHPDLVQYDSFTERLNQCGGLDTFMSVADKFFRIENA